MKICDKLDFENGFYISNKYHIKFQRRNNFLVSQSKFDKEAAWGAKVKSKLSLMGRDYVLKNQIKKIANNLCCTIRSSKDSSQSETDFIETPY